MLTRMKRLRLAQVLALVAVGGVLAALLWQRQARRNEVASAPAQPGPTSAPPPRPEGVVLQRPVITHREGGRLAWQVSLRELKVAAGAESVAAVGMREAVIYDKTGLPAMRLTAQNARGNTADRNLEVFGDVRAATPKGALITTDQVRWLEKERRLLCPNKVVVRTRSAAMTTRGLSYLVDEDTIRAPNLVRVYSGRNKLLGRELVYNVQTEAFTMKKVQAIFNPQEVRRTLAQP